MFGIGLASICAAVAWVVTINNIGLTGETDIFGLAGWYPRVVVVGGIAIGIMAIARYLTRRTGRGLRLGLAGFIVVVPILLIAAAALVYFKHGGSFADTEQVTTYLRAIWSSYGAALLISAGAFLASELLTGRL